MNGRQAHILEAFVSLLWLRYTACAQPCRKIPSFGFGRGEVPQVLQWSLVRLIRYEEKWEWETRGSDTRNDQEEKVVAYQL